MTRTCSVDGCGRKHLSLGYCSTHYQRLRRHGDPRIVAYATGLRGQTAINAAKTHCNRGHEFDTANTRHDAQGHRHCRACHRDRAREMAAGYRAAGLRFDGKPFAPHDYETPTDHAEYTVAAVADVLAAGTSLVYLADVYEAQARRNLATWTPDADYIAAAAAWRGDELSVAA